MQRPGRMALRSLLVGIGMGGRVRVDEGASEELVARVLRAVKGVQEC